MNTPTNTPTEITPDFPCKVGETTVLHFINASTGCTCCSNENFTQGPYLNKEDAESQIKKWLDGTEPAPLASRYASRGRYSVSSYNAERITNNRFIIFDSVITIDDLSTKHLPEDFPHSND